MKFGHIRHDSVKRSLQHTLQYITYFMAHLFYVYMAPPSVVCVLLTCQSLDPEYKTRAFFHMYFQENNIVLYSDQYGAGCFKCSVNTQGKRFQYFSLF